VSGVLRLVATDLDGTLLGTGGVITERTRQVLDALDERGVTVVFVTGRPIRWMEHLWDHVGGHGLAVCSNGGIVYDVSRHEVIEARTISPAIGLEVADLIRAAVPGTLFALEKTTGFGKEPEFLPADADKDRPELDIGPLPDVFSDNVVKLLALNLEQDPAQFWASVEQSVGHLVTTTWSTGAALIEMSAAGVTKASTLEKLCDEMGIAPDEVVAFGDMPNDIPMLSWAGTSYAMANGHESAKQAADLVAPPHDQDGVATVLEGLFGL
jgi:Cof subfamily protein (haloacid dehalogenase superfamily)